VGSGQWAVDSVFRPIFILGGGAPAMAIYRENAPNRVWISPMPIRGFVTATPDPLDAAMVSCPGGGNDNATPIPRPFFAKGGFERNAKVSVLTVNRTPNMASLWL